MTNMFSMGRLRLLVIAVALVMCAPFDVAQGAPSEVEGIPVVAQTTGRYAGRSLADVLRHLQSLGLKVAFTSELVRPEMRVVSEPKATAPRQILDEVLAPHGLRATAGPKGTWLVVRAPKAAATAAPIPPPATVADHVGAGADKAPPVDPVDAEFRETVTVFAPETEAAPTAPHVVLLPAAVQRAPGAGDNVFHALQTLPGVSATEDWGSRLTVRGGGPDQNLTVMDGVEIHNPYRLFGITSAFNPEIVDRFELTAGGFGAQYGDRLSSILVVGNRQGTATRRLAGSVTTSFTDANVVLEGKLPGRTTGSWLVTGRRTYYDLIAERIEKLDFPDFQDLQAKGVWDPKPGHRLTLFALRSRESADMRSKDDRVPEDDLEVAVRKSTRNDVAAMSYSAPLGARASSRTVAAWYHYNDTVGVHGSELDESVRSNECCGDEDLFGTEVVAFTRDLDVRDVSVRQEFSVQAGSRHLFETGFDVHALRTGWEWDVGADMTVDLSRAMKFTVRGFAGPASLRIGGQPLLVRSTRDTTRAAVWFQDRYQPRAGVRIEPGLRIDRSKISGETIASPRLGIRLDLTPRTRLRVAIGRYTQSPGYEKLMQSDYFVDLTSADSGQLKSERSVHVIGAIERALSSSVTARVEAYIKTFDRLIVPRLETPAETAARVAPYVFPAAIASSVPSAPIVTTDPVNGATGHAYGFDVYVEKPPALSERTRVEGPQSRRDRLSGWASYTFGVANITNYGRQYPFDYDRRHSVSMVGTMWLTTRLDLSASLRVASGFPTTPAVGVRVAATSGPDGSVVPLKSPTGLYLWSVDRGGVENLNMARLPTYARLDLRVTFNPKSVTGRWQIYAEVFNVLNRRHGPTISYDLRHDPSSDRPRLVSKADEAIPAVPSFGVRFRF
jgi:hypothetical protein